MPASRAHFTDPLLTTRRGVLLATVAMVSAPVIASPRETAPPLLHAAGHYLVTPDGKAVFLAGSHEWANGQDIASSGATGRPFDFSAYLSFLDANNMNCIRLWQWLAAQDGGGTYGPVNPLPWVQTGGKFDLTQLNQPYFSRILSRVQDAAAQNKYVIVQCVNGTSMSVAHAWRYNPFNLAMNVNGINGDPNSTRLGNYVYQQIRGPIWNRITALLDKLISTLAQQSNVIWEVGNELQDDNATRAFQVAVVNYIKSHEQSTGALQHPVMISAPYPVATSNTDTNSWLLGTPADLVSLAGTNLDGKNDAYYAGSQPVAPGTKVCILDTDHIFGIGGNWIWVWTSFMRGYSILYMDDLQGTTPIIAGLLIPGGTGNQATEISARAAMAQTRHVASLVDMTGMVPSGNLSSTGYCLANPSTGEYIILAKSGGTVTVNLWGASGRSLQAEWLDLGAGQISSVSAISSTSSSQAFTLPYSAGVLIVSSGLRRGHNGRRPSH